jgi:hypothetical protein
LAWEIHVKKLILIGNFCLFFLLVASSWGQQIDAAFGASGMTAPSAASASGNYAPQTLGSGTFLGFSGDFLLKHRIGISGEVSWRASQNVYFGFDPYRPIFYNFNGIWVPRLNRKIEGELVAGIGAESIRIYQPFVNCSFTGCTNYVSNSHFMGAFGGGVRFYVTDTIFVRPEARLYLIHNNFDFSSGRATRFGLSIGFSLRPQEY